MKKIGFTTTVPVEIILSAGCVPVDLNNIFICGNSPDTYIDAAHLDGLPRNCCSWIKGLYAIGAKLKSVDEIVAVTNGDCSNTHALAELFQDAGMTVHFFSYPYGEKDPRRYLKNEMKYLASVLGTTLEKTEAYCEKTTPLRRKLKTLDRLTAEGKVTGFENHLWLVSSTDFNGNVDKFSLELERFIEKAVARKPTDKKIRLGYIGVPPINPGIYDFIEEKDCHVVFNEVQRQFSIPSENPDYPTRYLEYTYPYGLEGRIKDILKEIMERNIDGVIHYVQSFCYRQIQDVIIRKSMPVPVITIEGDAPGEIDGRTKIRLDSFIEMLENKKYDKTI